MFGRFSLVFLAALFANVAVPSEEQPTNPSPWSEERAQAQNSLPGVWKVIEQSSRTPGGAWTLGAVPYLSVYIFTQKHYSYMFVPGTGPRRLFAGDPNQPTDGEKVAAYNSFVAASGTYALAGSALTLNAILHKNPNEMTGAPLKYNVEVGSTTLRMTIANPPFAPGQERRTVLTRIE
jgi:hypothetical protein